MEQVEALNELMDLQEFTKGLEQFKLTSSFRLYEDRLLYKMENTRSKREETHNQIARECIEEVETFIGAYLDRKADLMEEAYKQVNKLRNGECQDSPNQNSK